MATSEAAIGRVIVERRKQLKLKQSQLAKKSGIKTNRIGRLERGEVPLRYHEGFELAFALDWSPADFAEAYLHAMAAPQPLSANESYTRRSDTHEVRDAPIPIFDLRNIRSGTSFGLQSERHLYVIELKNVLNFGGH